MHQKHKRTRVWTRLKFNRLCEQARSKVSYAVLSDLINRTVRGNIVWKRVNDTVYISIPDGVHIVGHNFISIEFEGGLSYQFDCTSQQEKFDELLTLAKAYHVVCVSEMIYPEKCSAGVIFDHTLYKMKWDWLIEHPGKNESDWLSKVRLVKSPECAYAHNVLMLHEKNGKHFKDNIDAVCIFCPFGDFSECNTCIHELYAVWCSITNVVDLLHDAHPNRVKDDLYKSLKILGTTLRDLPLRTDMNIHTK